MEDLFISKTFPFSIHQLPLTHFADLAETMRFSLPASNSSITISSMLPLGDFHLIYIYDSLKRASAFFF